MYLPVSLWFPGRKGEVGVCPHAPAMPSVWCPYRVLGFVPLSLYLSDCWDFVTFIPFPFLLQIHLRVLCIFVRFPFVFYQFDFVFIVIILNASVNGLVYLFYSVIYSFFHFCFLPFVSGFINLPMVTRHRSCLQQIPFVLFYFCFPLSPLFSFCNFIDFILFIPILFPVQFRDFTFVFIVIT